MAGYIGNKAVGLNVTTGNILGDVGVGGDIDVDGTANLDIVDIDGAVDMASTLQLDGAITLGVAGTSNGFINSPSGIFVNIDSDNNQTDRFFDVRKNSTDGSGTLLFQVVETGAATIANGLTLTDGNLVVAAGHGIDFSAQTASSASGASATAELLDHYEEGTCTLVVAGSGGGTRTMGSNNKAFYTRVGRLVTLSGTLHVTGGESLSGNLKITGIPFDADPAANHRTAMSIGGNQLFDTGANGTHLTMVIDPNAAFIWVLGNNDSTPTFAHLVNAAVKANQNLYGFNVTYMTDA